MQIAQVMAGYTLGGADMLRRAMGKKKPEEMAKQRTSFLEGSEQNGIDADLAGNIFDLVEKFAGYGFNKSHSAAYALVSYQTAWLKAHYPAPFMAAVLSSDMQNTDKVVIFIEECRTMELPLVLPDVNCGEYMFTVNDDGEIVYGLGAIKGVGEGPIEAIVEARADGGEFTDLFDFCKRVGSKKLNKRVLEALVRCGALDKLGPDRAQLWAAIPEALKAADQNERNQSAGMFDLFGEVEAEQPRDPYAEYMKLRKWTDKERLQGEKDTLGLYVTGHPIDEYESELPNFISKRIVELQPQRGQQQKMLGLVVDIRVKKTKKGDPLCFVTLDDRTSRIEVSLFGEAYDEYRTVLNKDSILLIEGEISIDSFSGTDKLKVRGNKVVDITQCRARYGQYIEIDCQADQLKERQLKAFEQLLQSGKGPSVIDVALRYSRADASATVCLGESWRIEPTDDILLKLKDQFGGEAVRIRY